MARSIVRFLLFLLIVLLLLEVMKRSVLPFAGETAFVWTVRLSTFQMILLVGGIIGAVCWILIKKITSEKKAILFSAVLSCSFLVAIEWGCTRWMNRPETIPVSLKDNAIYYYDHFEARLLQYESAVTGYDSTLYYRFKPGVTYPVKNREFQTTVRTNNLGLRDQESALNAPAILFMGDSHTMGWGVAQQEAFPALIQQQSGLRGLNAGIPSYGTARELALLRMLDTSGCTHIVWQYCTNDAEENEKAIANGDRLPISSRASYNSLTRLYEGIRAYFPFKHTGVLGNRILKQQWHRITGNPISPYGRNPDTTQPGIKADHFWQLLIRSGIDFSKVKLTVLAFDHTGNLHNDLAATLQQSLAKSGWSDRL